MEMNGHMYLELNISYNNDLFQYFQVDREDLPSKCKNVANIDNIFLAQLERQISKLMKHWRLDLNLRNIKFQLEIDFYHLFSQNA